MKLNKGEQIEVFNVITKSHGKSLNSGFLNYKHHPREIGTAELPGAWIVTAKASALDCTICDFCGRLYNFGLIGARPQCDCKGCEVSA